MDPEKWLEQYSPQMGETQRKFFLQGVQGRHTVGWWRGYRYQVAKAIFDYIMDEREEKDNAKEKGFKEEDQEAR